jgi:hypothetical protein
MTCGAPSIDPTAAPRVRAQQLVALLGGHVSRQLALDLAEPDDRTLGRWLVASALLGGRHGEVTGVTACSLLDRAGMLDPQALTASDPLRVEQCLAQAELREPDRMAHMLARLCGRLQTHYDGSMQRLAAGVDGLEELAGRLAGLASGYGRASVLRYLTPLRTHWCVLDDLPSSLAARAAACDLGFIDSGDDEESTPSGLARALASDTQGSATDPDPAPALRDLEAALERLGRRACLRGRLAACPFESSCPRRR